jgi:predicted protein tyrosine phosphatase
MKIIIMPIIDLVHYIQNLLNNPEVAIIFATKKPNYYFFGTTPFLHLNIPDTTVEEDINVGILNSQIKELIDFIANTKAKILYICCDAGLSRSPAIGMFVAQLIKDDAQYNEIKETHCFANIDLYERLIERLNDIDKCIQKETEE